MPSGRELLTFSGLQPQRRRADKPLMDSPLDLLPAAAANDGAPSRARHVPAPVPRAPAPGASANGPRLGELLGALSHALDMTEGQPVGHCMRSC